MAQKPSIPKGTRDFSPAEVSKRNYIFSIIKRNFEHYGFQPIETPSFENSETLMGKYGEEGDRLIFKILNSGDYLINFNKALVEILKDVVFNLQNSLQQNREIVDNDFLNMISLIIQKAFKKHLPSEKTNYSRLMEDIKDLISRNVLQRNDVIYDLVNAGNNKITDLTIRIFGDFYFNLGSQHLGVHISEKALRYDLTVPFARYVVQHQNDIEFPFKRYQMQPVWRADRPQKGRFREFYQCDADVVGSKSLWQEVELVQLYDAVFADLGLAGVTIKINNRKILSGIAEVIGAHDKLIDFTVALDKLDKIGADGVKKEMLEKGISEAAIAKVEALFSFSGTIAEKLPQLSQMLAASEEGMKGIEELQFICHQVSQLGLRGAELDLDVTLARGLNYYTGSIFEVSAPKTVSMGSIGGGGRYDDLTGIFGLDNMSGVGISFGLDRIYLVLEELNLFPKAIEIATKALFINYGEAEAFYAMQAIQKLRQVGITVELYPDAIKVGKQFGYADKRNIPFAVIVGETEMQLGQFGLKNLQTGEQTTLSFDDLKERLSEL